MRDRRLADHSGAEPTLGGLGAPARRLWRQRSALGRLGLHFLVAFVIVEALVIGGVTWWLLRKRH